MRSWTVHQSEVMMRVSVICLGHWTLTPMLALLFCLWLFVKAGLNFHRLMIYCAAGESIPIRLFLSGYEMTPTMRDINKKFSVRYYLNLVLIDEEERRYFKQQVHPSIGHTYCKTAQCKRIKLTVSHMLLSSSNLARDFAFLVLK